MARRKAGDDKVKVGNITRVSGKVTIAGGDVYEGYTVEQVSLLLKEFTTNYRRKPFDGRCPYKGLDVFEEEDADLFFGRERLVDDLLSRVKESRTVFITGPSGSGKSSLVRAGLIHALRQGAVKNLHSERWLYETMKPGREPIKDLSLAFSRLKGPDLADYFLDHAHETDVLNKCAESVLSGQKTQHFVLFVDQFEEVFTQINAEDERQAFINMLAHAGTVEDGRVIVLFAMRSDFVSNCATYPALNELLSQEFRQIGAMQPEELVCAIALPAIQVGLPIEDDLIARIINDMKGEPGALPLMQFALKDLFDSQQAKDGVIQLTLADYLRQGGIQKSLERHADASLAALDEKSQTLARSIFSGLIEVGRGTQDTKRTALFDELVPASASPEEVLAIVQKLADARLIITDEQAGKDTVTISHEKLIEAWPWLRKLVDENRDVIALQNEIASDAKEWYEHQCDPSYLYTGARLANAREQLDASKIVLSGLAKDFIDAGAKAYADELETSLHRTAQLRKRSLYLSLALIMAMIAVGVAVFFSVQSRQQTKIALARQLAAQAQSINTTRNSKQLIAVLLAVQSMRLFPTSEGAQVLLNNNFAAHEISRTIHDDIVTSVAFSPDGKYVASAGEDATIRVWEAMTGREIARMVHDDSVWSLAFSPDGKYVVTGSADGTARVWEVMTGKEVARMAYDHVVSSVAFSPDGKYVVSGSGDGTVRVWEAFTGKEVARMIHGGEVVPVGFSPDGKYVVSGSWDDTARVWEAFTGKEVARMTHDNVVWSVAFSANGKYVVSGSWDDTARVWEAFTGKEVARKTQSVSPSKGGGGAVQSGRQLVGFSRDGKYVVSGSDKTASIWETLTGKEIAHMTHDEDVSSVAFSPDGKYVVSGSADGTARVWETLTGKEIARMTHDSGVTSVAFSPDGKYVVSGSADGTARVWEANPGNEVNRWMPEELVLAVSPDGKYSATRYDVDTVRVWDTTTEKEITRITHDGVKDRVDFSRDGKYILTRGDNGFIRIWETSTGREFITDRPIISADFSPDGKYLIMSSDEGMARVLEAASGKEVNRMIHDGGVMEVSFSPDGKHVMTKSEFDIICIWEVPSGMQVARLIPGYPMVLHWFSPDGKFFVTQSNPDSGTANTKVWEATSGREVVGIDDFANIKFSPDKKYLLSVESRPENPLRVWDVMSGKEIAHMTHDNVVTDASFSPDEKYVVSGSWDKTARVWETFTGKEVARMTHDSSVNSVAFSSDGKYVVSAGDNDTIRVWEAMTGKEIARKVINDVVWSVGFSADGKYVIWDPIGNGIDPITYLWQPSDLIANACELSPRNLTPDEWKQYIGDALPYQTVCENLPIEPGITPSPIPTGAACPYAYTVDPVTGKWKFQTTILYKIVDHESAQQRTLEQFTGKLLIREEESEISYLNQVYVLAKMSDGSTRILEPDVEKLKREDSGYIILHQGEKVLISFKDYPVIGEVNQWWVVAVGYYSPLR